MPHGDWDQLSTPQTNALRLLFRQPGAQQEIARMRGVRLSTWNSLLRYGQVKVIKSSRPYVIDAGATVAITDSGLDSIGVDKEAH